MNLKDTYLASLVPIFLGFGFVIAKPAMEYFPHMLLMGMRFVFAASTIWNADLRFLQSYSWIMGAFITYISYYLLASR